MSFAAAENDRRVANAISIGVVTAIDAGAVRARVRVGGLETPFIPVMQPRVGQVKLQTMPSVGEQVSVAAPDGDFARAFVLGSITAGNAPGDDAGNVYLDLGGGELVITGDIVLDGDIRMTGTLTSDEDVVASGISLTTHVHGGVQSGGSNTAGPS